MGGAEEVLELLYATTSEEEIGVDELEVVTILLESLASVSGQNVNVCDQLGIIAGMKFSFSTL